MRMTFWVFTALIPVLMAGCASSERMSRMSGGVFQEYSAPKAKRIQPLGPSSSKSNQIVYAKIVHPEVPLQTNWTDATPVNVWPFFFRSAYYTSILWPIIDWDNYGFAVRPFCNQEGNERAVLFPLSAWNPVNGDGWVLSAAWNPYGFGVIPFFWHHRSGDVFWYHVGPLLIHSADVSPLTPRYFGRKSFFWLFPLYLNQKEHVDDRFRQPMCRNFTPELKQLLAYRLAGTGIAVPNSEKELERLGNDPEAAKKLPLSKTMDLGVPLLFHVSSEPQKTNWRALAYLIGGEDSEKYFAWDVLGPFLARYRNRQPGNDHWTRNRLFLSLFLLTYYSHDTSLLDPYAKAVQKLMTLQFNKTFEDPAQFRRKAVPQINAELKKLDPAWKLPGSVTTCEIYRLWLLDFFRGEDFRSLDLPVKYSRSGGFLPLFWFRSSERTGERSFFSFAGMTYFGREAGQSRFWSLPLLTYRINHEFDRQKGPRAPKVSVYRQGGMVRSKETFWIAPPLIWHSDRIEWFPHQRPIQPAATRWAEKHSWTVNQNDFSALGLYYHQEMAYYAAKPGVDYQIVDEIRRRLPWIATEMASWRKQESTTRKELARLEKTIESERKKLEKDPDSSKVALYEKMLECERARQRLKEIGRKNREFREELAGLAAKAEKIGFRFDPESAAGDRPDAARILVEKLLAEYAELRRQEDYGSAFFYRRKIRHNGDFSWHLLGILAGGEKNGARETCHVLQFLYRFSREGCKVEKIYFPFVSIREDGPDRRFSFLGRVYQKTVKADRTGGYIFFIPFGERIQ